MSSLQDYICNVAGAEWVTMVDDNGNVLPGIVGKHGARGAAFGREIGGDIIKMEAGTAFPLHVHEGAHILYILEGTGYVHIDGADLLVQPGDMAYIPAGYFHAVRATHGETLTLVSVGYPHHKVDSRARMKVVEHEQRRS